MAVESDEINDQVDVMGIADLSRDYFAPGAAGPAYRQPIIANTNAPP